MNNVQREISLAVASIENIDTIIILKNGGSFINGSLGNLELKDLTNYPKTAITDPCVIVPYTLFSVKENSQQLLIFKVIIYTDDHPDKPTDVGMILNIELNSLTLVYIQQPFLRIIDYFMSKILGFFDSSSLDKESEM